MKTNILEPYQVIREKIKDYGEAAEKVDQN